MGDVSLELVVDTSTGTSPRINSVHHNAGRNSFEDSVSFKHPIFWFTVGHGLAAPGCVDGRILISFQKANISVTRRGCRRCLFLPL